MIKFLRDEMGVKKIRFPEHCGIGIKPCSEEGKRTVRARLNTRSPTIVIPSLWCTKAHHEVHRGAFKDWGYWLAREEFGGELIDGGPWVKIKNPNTGKDRGERRDRRCVPAADPAASGGIRRYRLYELNGDYISDATAAQVGGIGIAPGANIGDECALFESDSRYCAEVCGGTK